MTDSQKQAISSAWIGKRVSVKKERIELHGTLQYFGEIISADGDWCGIELDESLGENDGKILNERYFECKDNHGIFVPASETKQLPCKIFANNFDLKEIANTCLNETIDLGSNKTFNVSQGNDNEQNLYLENQISAAVSDKNINPLTLKSNFSFEKQVHARLGSEESLGVIPDAQNNFNRTLNSCSAFFSLVNFKNKACNIAAFKEPQNLDLLGLKRLCFENFNSSEQNCIDEEMYTSTLVHPLKNINFGFDVQQKNQRSSPLHDEVNIDEPILAGLSQTVSKFSFDEEFDGSKILSSTSKLSSLLHQIMLKKTSNFHDGVDLNAQQTCLEKHLETSNGFEKFDTSRVLNDNRQKLYLENQISAAVKSINPPTLKSNFSFEKQVHARLDSEESLGIIPDALDDFNGTLDSCSAFFSLVNFKNEACNMAPFEETSQNLDLCNLKRLCFENFNSPEQNCVNEEIYTSTPMHPLKHINFDFDVQPQKNQHCSLNDEVDIDESILAGSSQTVSKISFDDEGFDRSKILSSTSKLSSLLHQHMLKKASNFNDGTDLNALQACLEKPLETSNRFEKFDASRALNDTYISNTTFEIKRTVSSPPVFISETFLAASPILSENRRDQNKPTSMHDLTCVMEEEEGTIENSKLGILTSPNEWNKTKVFHSVLNNLSMKSSEIKTFESQNELLNKCSDSASKKVSLRRASLDSRDFSKTICFNISANSLHTSESANSTFNANTTFSVKNDVDLQAKQFAAEHFNKRYSLSAVPVLSKTCALQKHLPASSNSGCLPKSSISKSIGIEAKIPKNFVKSTSTCLTKSVNPSEKNKAVCNNINAFKHSAVQSKNVKINKANLKGTASIHMKTDKITSLDAASIKPGKITKHLTISQSENTFLSSRDGTSDDLLKIKKLTFPASEYREENVADNKLGECEGSDEIPDKNVNAPAKLFEESLINKLGTEVVNLTSTEKDNFVANFLDKTVHISHSCEQNIKDSTSEIKDSIVSVKGVKSIHSKPIAKPRLSSLPTCKSNISGSLSSGRNSTSASLQLEDKFKDSSKLYSRKSTQVPRFHLKPSTELVKKPMRSQEKALQKENIEVNSIQSGKNAKLSNKQSSNQQTFQSRLPVRLGFCKSEEKNAVKKRI